MAEEYNWWTDPKNKEEVERISWWNHEKNKESFNFPISVVQSDDVWVVACNDETTKLLGEGLHSCSQGKTKEEAIASMFQLMRLTHEYAEECRLNYQRWVPLRVGPWKHRGGRWLAFFGLHVYFRHGKGMKGGHYIPFTKLNVSFSSDWTAYKKYKQKKNGI